jgi:hypothetical protein
MSVPQITIPAPTPRPISLEPGLGQPPLHFESVEDFGKWLEIERNHWSWIRNEPGSPPNQGLSNLYNQSNKYWAQLEAATQRAANDAADSSYVQLQEMLTGWAAKGIKLVSKDPRSLYIDRIREEDATLAGHILVAFVSPNSVDQSGNGVQGAVLAAMYHANPGPSRVDAILDSLKVADATWSSFHSQAIAANNHLLADQRGQLGKLSDSLKNYVDQLNSEVESGKKTLEAIAKTYDEKLSLQAPVQLWRDRESWHRRRYVGYTIVFLMALVATVWIIWLEFNTWLKPFLDKPATDSPPLWPIVAVLASAAFFFWPLRIIARMLLSNAHLSLDAAERAAMAETYLSLLRSDQGLPDGDRKLILEALFRGSATGIVKEDHAPPSTIDVLSQLISGR